MKYGISLLPDCRPEMRTAKQYFDDVLRLAELGDELGFSHVKMTEHYLHAAGGYCPSPLAYLSAVAARTSRIRLLTGGIQASFHHPIQTAAETAQVDVMSGGRLDVGFARAFLPNEFEAFGVSMDGSTERFRSTVRSIVRLWTEEDISEDTPYYRYENVTSFPQPIQRPHPPVWICAVMSESSFRWAGEQGFNLLVTASPRPEAMQGVNKLVSVYRDAFMANHGASGRSPETAMVVPLVLADTDEEALEEAKPHLQEYIEVWKEAAASVLKVNSADYRGYSQALAKSVEAGSDGAGGNGVIGSPETAARRVKEMQEVLDMDTILWQVDFGGQPYEKMERTLRLFTDRTLPMLG
ncbi:LLM class flavin-dependent oxidoreductase [Actinomadura meridiana]|uniref:LLM class flavin-dependent oxidoreductase n=1 Tax=Actinomadura meridiana TaxID=559626 RepID=A0ABP8C208_9ACTN